MSFKDGKLVYGDVPGAQVGAGIAMTLVLDGKVNIINTPKMATGRNTRTACGQKANGNILFVTVDNMTTQELAEYMIKQGCIIAFQGDSGDSTGYFDGVKLYDQGRAIAGALVAYREVEEMFTVVKDIQLSKNFKLSEFVCKDGSGKVLYVPELIDKLQKLRDKVGKSIRITSAYRTPEYNKNCGGIATSLHLSGEAADIKVSGMTPLELAKAADKLGFKGIGVYPTFTHVDVCGSVKGDKIYWVKDRAGVRKFINSL
jgi:hypothetical protein